MSPMEGALCVSHATYEGALCVSHATYATMWHTAHRHATHSTTPCHMQGRCRPDAAPRPTPHAEALTALLLQMNGFVLYLFGLSWPVMCAVMVPMLEAAHAEHRGAPMRVAQGWHAVWRCHQGHGTGMCGEPVCVALFEAMSRPPCSGLRPSHVTPTCSGLQPSDLVVLAFFSIDAIATELQVCCHSIPIMTSPL